MDSQDEKIEKELHKLEILIPLEDTYEYISKLMWTVKILCEVINDEKQLINIGNEFPFTQEMFNLIINLIDSEA